MAGRDEILQAIYEADRLHKEFKTKENLEQSFGRIDVFGMLFEREIPVLFRPLKNLLGVYISDPGVGVMVTTQRQLRVQRFTAAHELGHAELGHEASLDDEDILERPIYSSDTKGDPREDQANAFAAQLLTPHWLVVHHMKRQGWKPNDLVDPVTVYQLSLRMGSSYSATCYKLAEFGAVKPKTLQKLLGIPPKTIKQSLVKNYKPKNWYGDVWVVTERDSEMALEGSRSDIVLMKLREHSGAGYMWQFGDLHDVGLNIVEDGAESDVSDQHIGGMVLRTVIAEVQNGATGHINLREVRPWQPTGEPLHSFELDLDMYGPVSAGLHPAQQERVLLEAA